MAEKVFKDVYLIAVRQVEGKPDLVNVTIGQRKAPFGELKNISRHLFAIKFMRIPEADMDIRTFPTGFNVEIFATNIKCAYSPWTRELTCEKETKQT